LLRRERSRGVADPPLLRPGRREDVRPPRIPPHRRRLPPPSAGGEFACPPRRRAVRMRAMPTFLVTGGVGFFGGILRQRLLDSGASCVSIDLGADDAKHPALTTVQGDIRDQKLLDSLAADRRFDAVFHCAAILAHDVTDEKFLWSCNVDGTRAVAEFTRRHRIPKLIFTSTNCLWATHS